MYLQQEGQDGPRSPTCIFERTIANFFWSLSEKNLQEFLYVRTVQVAPIHQRNISMKLFQNLTSGLTTETNCRWQF